MAMLSAKILGGCCAAVVLGALAGCQPSRPGIDIPTSGALSTWRWRAVSMKVSALTTPFPSLGEEPARLDVRVAFFDSDNDETKALGQLWIELTSAGKQVARVEVELTDERQHHLHWDTVTETYSISVPLPGMAEPRPGQALEVRASFEGEDGALMHARRDIRWPQAEPGP